MLFFVGDATQELKNGSVAVVGVIVVGVAIGVGIRVAVAGWTGATSSVAAFAFAIHDRSGNVLAARFVMLRTSPAAIAAASAGAYCFKGGFAARTWLRQLRRQSSCAFAAALAVIAVWCTPPGSQRVIT